MTSLQDGDLSPNTRATAHSSSQMEAECSLDSIRRPKQVLRQAAKERLLGTLHDAMCGLHESLLQAAGRLELAFQAPNISIWASSTLRRRQLKPMTGPWCV